MKIILLVSILSNFFLHFKVDSDIFRIRKSIFWIQRSESFQISNLTRTGDLVIYFLVNGDDIVVFDFFFDIFVVIVEFEEE